jgi:uncharacterized protein (UPF0248 family)
MTNPRIILNELKWKEEHDINQAEIWYIHRGAPNDTKIITGEDIEDLEKSFMKTNTSMIPYHRIIKIVYKNETIFKRRKK